RATAGADELEPDELVAGADRLRARVVELHPVAVAFLGISAYRRAFAQPKAVTGRQPDGIGAAQLWVVPNPSGGNFHAGLDDLAAAYREVATAAGIEPL